MPITTKFYFKDTFWTHCFRIWDRLKSEKSFKMNCGSEVLENSGRPVHRETLRGDTGGWSGLAAELLGGWAGFGTGRLLFEEDSFCSCLVSPSPCKHPPCPGTTLLHS